MKTYIFNKGFTLIEVLLVITLIGILLSIGIVNFNSEFRLIEARNDIRQTHIQTLETAITQYRLQKGNYPDGLTRDYQEICDPDASSCIGFFNLKQFLVPNYLQAIPKDPKDTDNTGGSGYEIAVDEASNTVSIRLKESLREGGVDIQVNDPLPNLETSNVNTPLATTVPKFPIVTEGLVLSLDADNQVSYPGTGNTWFDLSGNENHGTLVNSIGYSSANFGSLTFDGVDDYVSLDNPINNFTLGTIECWFKLNTPLDNNYHQILTRTNTNIGTFTLEKADTNNFRFNMRLSTVTPQYIIESDDAATSNWTHLVGTYDGQIQRFYINSVEQTTSNTISGVIDTGGTPAFRIGGNTNGSAPFAGNIAQVSIYNRALTAEEVQQNFNATRNKFGI
jgi:prepilin-type N-terminal cleavage/methylation domain-containing protein